MNETNCYTTNSVHLLSARVGALGVTGRGFESRLYLDSDVLSTSFLISETIHINNKRNDWNVIFQNTVVGAS